MPDTRAGLQAPEKSKPEQGGGSLPRRSDRTHRASVPAAFYRLTRGFRTALAPGGWCPGRGQIARIAWLPCDGFVNMSLRLLCPAVDVSRRCLIRIADGGFVSDLTPVSYTHLRAHETPEHLVCRLL